MSGISSSLFTPVAQTQQSHSTADFTAAEKTGSDGMAQLTRSVHKYLSMDENPYDTQATPSQVSVTAPWMFPSSTIFEWWVRLTYKGQNFEKQLDVSIKDFQQKFLKHPYYTEDVFFNIDDDPEDDIKVSFGFYWETILNTKTNEEDKSLEDMVRVRQINSGPSDIYAGLDVWSEIHVNWGLVNAYSTDDSSAQNSASVLQTQKSLLFTTLFSFLKQLLEHRKGYVLHFLYRLLEKIRDILLKYTHKDALPSQPQQDPQELIADDDYFAVGVGYRTAPGDRIPQYVEKRFSFAKDNIFSPTIFQQVMKTEPSGIDPLELLYGFRAYNGSTDTCKYDIAFSVGFTPFITLTTQFIPLGGYIYYRFDTDSQHNSETKITYSSDVHIGTGNGTSLSLVFDKIDQTMGHAGQWMSFGLRKDPHGFDYEASNIFNVAVIVDSPWFTQKVRLNGLPKTISYEWKIFDDFEVTFVQGELFYVNVRGYADVTMSSPMAEVVVYYPKLRDPSATDVTFLKIQNIPSSRRLEAQATLNIQNGSMLQVDTSGYVDLSKSGSLGDITVYYPKADPADPDVALMRVPAGTINNNRISAEATLYVDPHNFSNIQNYVYGKVQRQADSNFHEMDFYLPGVSVPLVQITDIPAMAYATGTFWWGQLRGSARAERSSASQNPDPVHFNIVFDTLTLSDAFSIGDGHVQTDFQLAKDGYFQFDTAHDVLGNTFTVSNSATGNAFTIGAQTVSAKNFAVNWGLNTSGPQLQVEQLALAGTLNALRDFVVALTLYGKNGDFTGDWSLGKSGGFSFDFQQSEDVRIDLFNLTNVSGRIDLNGYVIVSNILHYDMSWQWKQGSSLEDPGYFKVNEGTNDPNIKEIGFEFIDRDDSGQAKWGTNITLTNFAVYICIEWYWDNGFQIWPVIEVDGELNLNLLLNYNWYEIWP
jgi:hypothetical protein